MKQCKSRRCFTCASHFVLMIIFGVFTTTISHAATLSEVMDMREANLRALVNATEGLFAARCFNTNCVSSASSTASGCSFSACGGNTLLQRAMKCNSNFGTDSLLCGPGCSGLLRSTASSVVTVASGATNNAEASTFVCSTSSLTPVFEDLYENHNVAGWQCVVSNTGVTRSYPAAYQTSNSSCSAPPDARQASWYVTASTGSKDVVFVCDFSGSMTTADGGPNGMTRAAAMKIGVISLLGSLGPNDRFNIICFSTTYTVLGPAGSLLAGTAANILAMQNALKAFAVGGGTVYAAPFSAALALMKSTTSTGCARIVMFLSDGAPSDSPTTITTAIATGQTALGTNRARIFTYSLSTAFTPALLQSIACTNGGMWNQIVDASSASSPMQQYYRFQAAGIVNGEPQWTAPYTSLRGQGSVVTVSIAYFDRSVSPKVFAGVAAIDVLMSELLNVGTLSQITTQATTRNSQCLTYDLTECQMQKLRNEANFVCPSPAPALSACTSTYISVPTCTSSGLANVTSLDQVMCSSSSTPTAAEMTCCSVNRCREKTQVGTVSLSTTISPSEEAASISRTSSGMSSITGSRSLSVSPSAFTESKSSSRVSSYSLSLSTICSATRFSFTMTMSVTSPIVQISQSATFTVILTLTSTLSPSHPTAPTLTTSRLSSALGSISQLPRWPTPSSSPAISTTQSASVAVTPTQSVSKSTTVTPTRSASMSATVTPTRSASMSATVAPTRSASMSATVTPTRSASMSATVAPTRSASMSATVTTTRSASMSATVAPTRSASMSATVAPTRSASMSATVTTTRSASMSATVTPTRSASMSATVTPTRSASMSATVTTTTTRSASMSATVTPTRSALMFATVTTTTTRSASMSATVTTTRSASMSATVTTTRSDSVAVAPTQRAPTNRLSESATSTPESLRRVFSDSSSVPTTSSISLSTPMSMKTSKASIAQLPTQLWASRSSSRVYWHTVTLSTKHATESPGLARTSSHHTPSDGNIIITTSTSHPFTPTVNIALGSGRGDRSSAPVSATASLQYSRQVPPNIAAITLVSGDTPSKTQCFVGIIVILLALYGALLLAVWLHKCGVLVREEEALPLAEAPCSHFVRCAALHHVYASALVVPCDASCAATHAMECATHVTVIACLYSMLVYTTAPSGLAEGVGVATLSAIIATMCVRVFTARLGWSHMVVGKASEKYGSFTPSTTPDENEDTFVVVFQEADKEAAEVTEDTESPVPRAQAAAMPPLPDAWYRRQVLDDPRRVNTGLHDHDNIADFFDDIEVNEAEGCDQQADATFLNPFGNEVSNDLWDLDVDVINIAQEHLDQLVATTAPPPPRRCFLPTAGTSIYFDDDIDLASTTHDDAAGGMDVLEASFSLSHTSWVHDPLHEDAEVEHVSDAKHMSADVSPAQVDCLSSSSSLDKAMPIGRHKRVGIPATAASRHSRSNSSSTDEGSIVVIVADSSEAVPLTDDSLRNFRVHMLQCSCCQRLSALCCSARWSYHATTSAMCFPRPLPSVCL
ncbi:membrane-associated protein, putative [Bodo saltans]|uniref:Membrane-associated protein, putative n=1 Tax=Bodo saltans TaxID=75058 RepID=A0A0S4JQL0_BODSA|nr:membrane-associated protein, putative [Bodo saltans]|eukprot:CUG93785.1 membrane-associated protein, putative [Bodo saltans]